MAPKRSHFVALFFSMFAVVLFIFANLGITVDNSPFLKKIFIMEGSQTKTGESIRYGFYSSCVFKDDSVQSCTEKSLTYTLDVDQLGDINGINLDAHSIVKQIVENKVAGPIKAQKIMVVILPAAILAFIGMIVGMMMRRMRTNNVLPTFGALASLLSCVCGAVGIAYGTIIYRNVFEQLARSLDGIMYYYGPTIYIVGVACGCEVVAFGFFIASCFARRAQYNHSYESYERHSFSSEQPSMHQHRY
ncbi:hypothetical protein BDA99DRAFT_574156 [Phascolomyces articulosus]|uniref:Uncharacterized protein n=1 Tax=Phascolomyces articulosus TaxID=60185 RepID=A0AAD5PB87_9FUNG|nr:hypothetical protein BDA99DRAFT_574156 [Phascolomyces articulosus]